MIVASVKNHWPFRTPFLIIANQNYNKILKHD